MHRGVFTAALLFCLPVIGLSTRILGQETSQPASSSAPAPTQPAAPEPRPPAEKPSNVTPSLPAEWVDQFHWRCIGPAAMGGRITALAVCETDPTTWWAATASGGLLKTKNNGITFEHQFDREAVVSIGDVAVAPSDPSIVWIGTGENNPRNSVSWGNGVYKSTDGGKTWQHMGLAGAFQIGHIAIHPTDPNIVYVGALGRLWGHNEERGLYKTTDGGRTWNKVLYIDDKTGVIDVQLQPQNPNVLLAATYERQRDGYDSNDPAKKYGPGAGIYKSTDAGATWRKITAGLPTDNLGRIGLDFYRKDPNAAYLVLESQRIGKEPRNAPYLGVQGEDANVGARLTEVIKGGPAEKAGLRPGDIVVSINGLTVQSFADLSAQIRRYLAGESVQLEISRDRKSIFADVTFAPQPFKFGAPPHEPPFSSGLGGQRENVQDQQGPQGHEYGGVYRSSDAGETWTRINSLNPRPMYFSQIRVDPSDNNYLWVLGIDLYRSSDGGLTFTPDGGRDAHPDHHALWIDPHDGRHMILGNDGGIYQTYDRAEKWDFLNHVAIGQFYHVTVDPRRNYKVYGGLQDNGTWGGPNRSASAAGPVNGDWSLLGWGDGFICRVDAEDPNQVYFESQNGGMGRYNFGTAQRGWLNPIGENGLKYEFNWKTPFLLSQHNSRVFYAAGNYVFRSLNRGDHLRRISREIVRSNDGTATALAESPHDPDVLYVGTDDGWLWITRDGSREWKQLIDFPTEKTALKQVAARAKEIWGRMVETIAQSGLATRPAAPGAATQPVEAATQPTAPGGRVPPGAAARLLHQLLQYDLNRNGRIERDEVPPRLLRIFNQFDLNHDGVIDESEMRAAGEDLPTIAPGGEPPPPPDQAPQPTTQPSAAAFLSPLCVSVSLWFLPSASAAAPVADPVSGQWSGKLQAGQIQLPPGHDEFTLSLDLLPTGRVTGTIKSQFGEIILTDGRFDSHTGALGFSVTTGPMSFVADATITGAQMTGKLAEREGVTSFNFTATHTAGPSSTAAGAEGRPGRPLAALLPGPRWVSWVETSRAKPGRVYITFDGHRSDDDEPYVFASEDYGQTWYSLRANLPTAAGSTRVIREDPENPNLLYLGTEFGAWVSIDRGESWTPLRSNLPTVAVHEFAIHPTSGEIVAATHGRSLWVLDVTALRQMSKETIAAPAFLYRLNTAIYWRPELPRGGIGGASGTRSYTGQNSPEGAQIYYSLKEKPRYLRLEIANVTGQTLRELEASPEPGLHMVTWDLHATGDDPHQGQGPLVPAGHYLVKLTVDRQTLTQELAVETDPDHPDYKPW